MAKIETYPLDENIQPGDKLIGTNETGNETRNYTVDSVKKYIVESATGNIIVNNPDEEDLTSVDSLLKFKDRDASGNQKGYKIIRADFDWLSIPANYADSIWEIRYEFSLGNAAVTLPDNVCMVFKGGFIKEYLSITAANGKSDIKESEGFDGSGTIDLTWVFGVVVDLGYVASPVDGIVTNTNGLNSTIPVSDPINAGLLEPLNILPVKGTPVAADILLIEDSEDFNNKKSVQISDLPGGSGESNTISNQGVGGVSVVASPSKSGVDLQLNSINAASSKVTVSLDGGNKKIDVDVVDATTSQKGAVELATDGESVANVVVQGNDSRLSDSRVPIGSAGGDLTGMYPNPIVTDGAITYAKMQDTSFANVLLGRGFSGPGEVEEITLGTNLTMFGTTLNATPGAGSTNLSFGNRTATQYDITSDTGLDATVTPATGTLAGNMPAADKTKVDFITVTQSVDLDSIETDVVLNNAKVTNATHTGDVTGSVGLTISSDVVDNTKLSNVPTATFKGRNTVGTGDPEDLTVSQAKTLLDLIGINSGDQTITLTGDVTGSGTGSFATTISSKAVNVPMLADGVDGELITWDSSGVASTVPTGGSGQVLTSNGAGTTPTFQTVSGTGDVVGPASSTDGNFSLFDGATGKLIKDGPSVGALASSDTIGEPDIDDEAVTLAKIESANANDKLLGSGNSGLGSSYSEVSLGASMSMAGTTINVVDGTTTLKGAVELATDGENVANVVVQGNDSRLSDSRAPEGVAGGDLTGTYPSPTVAANAITNAKLAQVAANSFKSNNTGAFGNTTDVSVSETTLVGRLLGGNIAALVPSQFWQYLNYTYQLRSTSLSTNGPDVIYTTLVTGSLPIGTYLITTGWVCQNTNAGGDWIMDLTQGVNAAGSNTSLLPDIAQEEGIDAGADQRYPRSFPPVEYSVAVAGVQNINLEMSQSGAGTFTTFWGSIAIFRVA
jgi:hypothetical protein